LPEVFPRVAAPPAFPLANFPPLVAYAEVVPPATDIPLPALDSFFQRDTPAGVPCLAHLLLQALHTPWGRANPPVFADPKTQELAVPRPVHAAFAGVGPQFQRLGNPGRETFQDAIPAPLTAHQDGYIVRVPAEADPAQFQFPVQQVQVQVRQQRTERRPLRGASAPLFVTSLDPYRRARIRSDKAQYPLVSHLATQPFHLQVMVDLVEEGADVQIDDPGLPCHYVLPCRVDRVVGASSGSVAIAVGTEFRVQ